MFSVESRFRHFKSLDRSKTWKKYIEGQYLCIYTHILSKPSHCACSWWARAPSCSACNVAFPPSFLLELFPWHLTEHWPWAALRAVEGRSSWVGEFPIMSSFTWQPCRMHTVTTMLSSCLGADWGTRNSHWFSCDKARGQPISLCVGCCANKTLLLTPTARHHI